MTGKTFRQTHVQNKRYDGLPAPTRNGFTIKDTQQRVLDRLLLMFSNVLEVLADTEQLTVALEAFVPSVTARPHFIIRDNGMQRFTRSFAAQQVWSVP